jgi:hypothetical protein
MFWIALAMFLCAAFFLEAVKIICKTIIEIFKLFKNKSHENSSTR